MTGVGADNHHPTGVPAVVTGRLSSNRIRNLSTVRKAFKVVPFWGANVEGLAVAINDWLEDPANAGWEVRRMHYQSSEDDQSALAEVEKWT